MSKRIGIDCRLWSEAGVGRYIRNLVKNLAEIDHDNDYYLFLLPKNLKQNLPKNFHCIEANYSWYTVAEQVKFPKLLDQYKLDLMHFPHFNVPIFYTGKFVVTIHDLIHQHFKMERATTHGPFIYKVKQFAYRKVFAHAIKKSQKVITVSDYVKKQLQDEWQVSPRKVVVTKEAAEETILDLAKRLTTDGVNQVLKKFHIDKPYIFYVGNAHPHKNVEGLINAFLTLRKNYQYLTLVLAGNDHYFWERIKKEYQHPSIIFTGFVSDLELVGLYKGAEVYVVPSFEEGFGIPLLEAFACGVPVVSSKLGSLKEVGGDAALYCDPHSQEDMAQKIMEILNNKILGKAMKEKGASRYKEFSWKKLAKNTFDLYLDI
jgi:glycosyltransferase involved in cell wall biosynthesis